MLDRSPVSTRHAAELERFAREHPRSRERFERASGSLVSGDGYAGELGHSKFIYGDAAELCACGQWGCLETVASAAALARRYTARTGRTVDGAREVMELLAAGDPDAAQVWHDALAALVDALVL